MKRLKICLINPKFEPSYWGFDYALPLYPGQHQVYDDHGSVAPSRRLDPQS